jgi:hypothetical protein
MISPMLYAREKAFIKQIIERSEQLQIYRENYSLCRQAELEYGKENYSAAIEYYSSILRNRKSHITSQTVDVLLLQMMIIARIMVEPNVMWL